MKDWTKLTKKYAGQWVALADDEETVIESERTLKEVKAHANEEGYTNPIFTRVPKEVVTYVGVL